MKLDFFYDFKKMSTVMLKKNNAISGYEVVSTWLSNSCKPTQGLNSFMYSGHSLLPG